MEKLIELGGRIIYCTQAEYDAMPHAPQTLYCITD